MRIQLKPTVYRCAVFCVTVCCALHNVSAIIIMTNVMSHSKDRKNISQHVCAYRIRYHLHILLMYYTPSAPPQNPSIRTMPERASSLYIYM